MASTAAGSMLNAGTQEAVYHAAIAAKKTDPRAVKAPWVVDAIVQAMQEGRREAVAPIASANRIQAVRVATALRAAGASAEYPLREQALAKQLKMERTRFVNPHGIDWKVKPLP